MRRNMKLLGVQAKDEVIRLLAVLENYKANKSEENTFLSSRSLQNSFFKNQKQINSKINK